MRDNNTFFFCGGEMGTFVGLVLHVSWSPVDRPLSWQWDDFYRIDKFLVNTEIILPYWQVSCQYGEARE